MKKAKMMKKYAALIANIGINANSKQDVVIKAPVETYAFVRYLVMELYSAKARNVYVDWYDSSTTRQTLLHVAPSRLSEVPQWEIVREKERFENNVARISLVGEDPKVFKLVKPERLSKYNKARVEAFSPYKKNYNNNDTAWCIAAVPTKKWAQAIFPNESPTQAVSKLWDAIYKTCRIDESTNTVEKWKDHIAELKAHADKLNSYAFKELRYKNSLGTDLTIGLTEGHIWCSAEALQKSLQNIFVPNLPTEEVFTMPDRNNVNGIVYASKPLFYSGTLIDGFWIKFENGKVVDYDAKEGKEALVDIINYDEGSSRLGEAALVPYDSPISKLDIIFQETLFDENAACHIALGASFPENIADGELLTEKELEVRGANQSKMHVDFMIGTSDLSIDGVKEDGTIVPVFHNGNFAF